LVYCHKCGTKNPDKEDVCKKCGSRLYPRDLEKEIEYHVDTCFEPRKQRERPVDECFGVLRGGAIFGILLGAIIILVGVVYFFGQAFGWNVNVWNVVWPLLLIVIGILIFAGAAYGLSRER
jgi:uncharacterized membrane protein YvbJ